MREIVIVSACRTPFDKFGGVMKSIPSIDLGQFVLEKVVEQVDFPKDKVEYIFYGTAIHAEIAPYVNVPIRQALLKAGYPASTLSMTVDRACCSSMTALMYACREIQAGEIEVAIAAGAENLSNVPHIVSGLRWGKKMGDWTLYDVEAGFSYPGWGPVSVDTDNVAKEYGITREEMDRWSLGSHQKYIVMPPRGGNKVKATIFEIKRFAVHDGDGIRTTVFFKGCPLKCVWCHNPEGIGFEPQLSYIQHKCISCGECVKVCKVGAHVIEHGQHVFYREKCTSCGQCEKVCLGEALKLYGREMTVEELMPLLLEDKDFYENTEGGVTLSGGECLMQADFCAELLKELKRNGIHTAVDTCGFVSREAIDKVMPYTDIFLYDVKAFEDEIHINCTGQSNKIILENLRYINDCGKKIEIRIPYVPDYNDSQVEKIAEFLSGLKHIIKVRVLSYHNYAGSKYESLHMENTLPERLPVQNEIDAAQNLMRTYGLYEK